MKTQKTIKSLLTIFAFSLLFAFSAKAQNTVDANEIIAAIKAGKDVSYENVTVKGALDFTFMDEKKEDLPTRRRWWRDGGDNTVNEWIESRVSFKNVTFEDDVIAYYHDNRSEYTFTADFEKEVTFENCTFERNAMFKYSTFWENASFAGSKFNDDNTFKYAEFERSADFSNTYFDDDAIFKYTEFRDGANFTAAKFDGSLDMKYTKIRGDFESKGMNVRWDLITKYAEVNDRSFNRALLDN